MLNYAYTFRINLIEQLLTKVRNFFTSYVSIFKKKLTNNKISNEKLLADFYGGEQIHCKSSDSKITQLYAGYKFDVNTNIINYSSQPLNTNNDEEIENYFSQLQITKKKTQITKFKKCDQMCSIPINWATRLYEKFNLLQPCYNFKTLQNNIIEFEKCYYCYHSIENDEGLCSKNSIKCQDTIRLIINLTEHFQRLRSVLRTIYSIRQLNMSIIELDNYLSQFNLDDIIEMTNFKEHYQKQTNALNIIEYTENVNLIDYDHLNKLKNNYEKTLLKKLDFKTCTFCLRSLPIEKFRLLNDIQMRHEIILNFIRYKIIPEDLVCPVFCCFEQCYKDIFDKNEIPAYSPANNMEIIEAPPCIKNLNFYEKLLIQKAKCFVTTINLKPLSTSKSTFELKAIKGLAIHMPITFEETHEYVNNTLPNPQALNIIINGLPTITNNIWRGLVNLDNVYKALEWLQINNVYYKSTDTNIISREILEKRTLLFNSDIKYNKLIKEQSYLTDYSAASIQHCTVMDFDKFNANLPDITKYSQKRVAASPMNDRDPKMDHLCFVELYPLGTGGMYDSRNIRIKPAMYIRWMLMHSNPSPRRNIQYLFSAVQNQDIRALESGIFASLRTSKMPNLTAGAVKRQIENNNQLLEANLATTMTAVRGSKEYWTQCYGDLRCMDEKFDCASLYLTLSCNEYDWEDLFIFLKQRNADLEHLEQLSLNDLIKIDPVSLSIFFEKKLRSFMSEVVLSQNGPFGQVEHYFYRREYQTRGAPHIHGKLWIKGTPKYGKDSDLEVINWIDKHITCRIPDPVTEPRLYGLVMKYQQHICTPSCLRLSVSKYKKGLMCRYGFPRKIQNRTSLNSIVNVLKSKLQGNKPIKLYSLKRRFCERYINDYNVYILEIWCGNHDLQYMLSQSIALDKYITSYITKAERNNSEELWDECNKNKTLKGALKSFGLKSLKERQMGVYEVADKLLGTFKFYLHDLLNKYNYNGNLIRLFSS